MVHASKKPIMAKRALSLKAKELVDNVQIIDQECDQPIVPTELGAKINQLVDDAIELRDLYLLQLLNQGESHRSAANTLNQTHCVVANTFNRINKRNKTANRPVEILFDIRPYMTRGNNNGR